jgi:hypothetical protein
LKNLIVTVLTALGWLLGLSISLFIVLSFFFQTEQIYRCKGHLVSSDGTRKEAIAFVKHRHSRWWAPRLGDSKNKGMIWIEVPFDDSGFYSKITEFGNQLFLWDADEKVAGTFSMLSRAIRVDLIGGTNSFEGLCEERP